MEDDFIEVQKCIKEMREMDLESCQQCIIQNSCSYFCDKVYEDLKNFANKKGINIVKGYSSSDLVEIHIQLGDDKQLKIRI